MTTGFSTSNHNTFEQKFSQWPILPLMSLTTTHTFSYVYKTGQPQSYVNTTFYRGIIRLLLLSWFISSCLLLNLNLKTILVDFPLWIIWSSELFITSYLPDRSLIYFKFPSKESSNRNFHSIDRALSKFPFFFLTYRWKLLWDPIARCL